MANLTLPKIVQQIRKQQPGVVPWWLNWRTPIPEHFAIAALEAELWKKYHTRANGAIPTWEGAGAARIWKTLDTPSREETIHGSDPLSLIHALCHAVGVRLEDADG